MFTDVRKLFAAVLALTVGLLGTVRADQPPSAAAKSHLRGDTYAQDRLKLFLERAKQGGVQVLFLGDSLTEGWELAGSTVWKDKFGKLEAAAFGVSGDRTQHLLGRIMDGKQLVGLKPKTVIVQIGSNNLGSDRHGKLAADGDRAEDIVEGIGALVGQVRQRLPEARIVLLGILPRAADAAAPVRGRIKEVNGRLAKFDGGKAFTFLDVGEHFLGPQGQLREDLMPDGLHLSAKGYAILAEALVSHLGTLAVAPAPAGVPPLIPRTVLFGNPLKTSPQISPDGKRLAYLAPDAKNVLQVWVQTLGKEDAQSVTADKKRGIRNYMWSYAADTLLYLQDGDGDENYHIHAVNLAGNAVRDLTPFPGVRAGVVALDRNVPSEVLVSLNLTDRRVMDVYRIDLTTSSVVLDTKNPGDVVGWQVDPKFTVRGAQAALPDGGTEIRYRKDKTSSWKTAVTWGSDDADGRMVGFTADGRGLWLLSSQGRDTLSLVKSDLESGAEEVLATDPRADAAGVLFNPLTHRVEAVSFNRERVQWKGLAPGIDEDLRMLAEGAAGEPSVVSRDRDLQTWVVGYAADVHPASYHLYDRKSKKLTHLFAAQPELAKYTLAPMKPVTIKSRDGLDLVCYLTLPVGVEAKNLPLVLMVHGGPWARDSWGFNSQTQWLANRGYAVLSVNYRGSTGFGKKFLHAGDREWAGKMHDDLIDGVQWAIGQGIADAKRVAIYGGSYGGYAALVGATFTPDVFACAVDVVGPSNLVTLLKSVPPYWAPMRKLFAMRVGDVDTEEEFLKSRSPLFKADRIKIPLLVAQGANDPRVKQAESEQIVEALRKAGKPVEYLLFADEGHGFARPENRLKFHAVAEAFLARHLGGGRLEAAP